MPGHNLTVSSPAAGRIARVTTARLLLADGAYRAEQSVLSNGRIDRMDETAKAFPGERRAVCAAGAAILRTHG
ncbi:hypothetical protein LMG31506_05535 [Cupriavidus yeoncheonensis]|uniref:Uncharacterized protein n=1 Tax=Cupriavidus yeoncheonensis TaxID=1462994 RepID=A0A916N773_9BURK|nr:hypothetical protein LMG31506_05535 [Cupriavidus yeoncheonensis]